MANKQASYHWLKKINRHLGAMDRAGLISRPVFDEKEFSGMLRQKTGLPELEISIEQKEWQEGPAALKCIESFLVEEVTCAPLKGHIKCALSQKSIQSIFSALFIESEVRNLSVEALSSGFFEFLLLQTLDILSSNTLLKGLRLQLFADNASSADAYLCLDVKIALGKQSEYIKVLLSNDFMEDWEKNLSAQAEKELQENDIEVMLRLNAAHALLSMKSFKKIKTGDFILLDQGTIDPDHNTAIGALLLEETPLFDVKIEDGKIKLADYALCNKERTAMKNFEQETMQHDFEEDDENHFLEDNEEEPAEDMDEAQDEVEEEGETMQEPLKSINDLPINLTVEISRFKIPLSKLKKLQPGNFLELPVSLKDNVNLTVNGEVIGRGELVKLGDTLGVKVLEIG